MWPPFFVYVVPLCPCETINRFGLEELGSINFPTLSIICRSEDAFDQEFVQMFIFWFVYYLTFRPSFRLLVVPAHQYH